MALIKNDMPPRLLGLGLNFMLPELVVDPDERTRLRKFRAAFRMRKSSRRACWP